MSQFPGQMANAGNRDSGPHKQYSESPDLMFVVRHYLWLIIIGTVLGIGVGVGLYYFFRAYKPTFSASRVFQVLSPQVSPINPGVNGGQVNVVTDPEEISRFMRRQQAMIMSDRVLDNVLQQYQSVRETTWFRDNYKNLRVQIKKDLKVVPEPSSELMRITMSGKVPVETAAIVNAVADEYMQQLKNDDATSSSTQRKLLDDAVSKMQNQVDQARDEMRAYRNTQKIEAITNSYSTGMQALGELQAAYTEAETGLNAAKANLANIQRQVQDGTLELTPDLELYVENDPQLRTIDSMKLQMQINRDVLLKTVGPDNPQVKALDNQLEAVTRRGDDIRETLRAAARLRMQDNANSYAQSAQARYDYVKQQREYQQTELRDLDRKLVVYRQMDQDLTELQRTFDDLKNKKIVTDLNNSADLSRVHGFGDKAKAPGAEDMTFPKLTMFGWGGLFLGAAGSFGVAWLLERTNTRVRTPRDITRSMEMPLLGFIPDQQDDSFAEGALALSVRTSPGSVIAESFRQIRGRLSANVNGKPLQTLLVASMSPGGGATTVASNIANGMALNDVRVLLVDANFYRPGLNHSYKNLPTSGLGELIAGKVKLEDVVVASEDLPLLHLMGPGMLPAVKSSELIESRMFRETILPLLKSKYDLVIFDGAPMNLVSDSIALGAKVDGVVAVVRAGAISKGMVARVRDQLKQVHANLVGLVLNAAQIQNAGYFRENYGTFYKYTGPSAQRSSIVVPATTKIGN